MPKLGEHWSDKSKTKTTETWAERRRMIEIGRATVALRKILLATLPEPEAERDAAE